jgi:hypothetical protein
MEHGQIRRTKEMGCGQLVEQLHCYATDKQLSEVERQDIIEWASRFEECTNSEDEFHAMPDAELIRTAYWIMAEYASGQV